MTHPSIVSPVRIDDKSIMNWCNFGKFESVNRAVRSLLPACGTRVARPPVIPNISSPTVIGDTIWWADQRVNHAGGGTHGL